MVSSFTTTAITTTLHTTSTALPPTSSAATVFANSTLDFNTQAGIIAGGFISSALLITLFVMLVFNCLQLEGINIQETCLVVFWKWLFYKYCGWCCKDYRKKLKKERERLRQEEEEGESLDEFVQVLNK